MPEVPGDLDKTYQTAGGWAGLLAGAGAGALGGMHIGIAGGPLGAIAGTVPGAIVGGIMGYFGGQKVGSKIEADPEISQQAENLGHVLRSCPNCGQKVRLPIGLNGTVKCPTCSGSFQTGT
jgi:phage tail tape-measure protein